MFFLGGLAIAVFVFFLFILGYLASQDKGKDRANVLILGESGPGHAGAPLSDMIILSYFSKTGSVFISVPRDLWYTPWQTKINALSYYSEQRGDGFSSTKEIMGEILGEEIDYIAIIDFKVFEEVVDLVGGIQVGVERAFDDFLYPIPGKEADPCDGDPEFRCRFEHIHFDAGLQHMDGEKALKFVRSRYAEGEEGTDQARSHRQQKVLASLKEKVSSPKVFLSPKIARGFWEIFEKRLKTDITKDSLIFFAKILANKKARQMESFVLDGWDNGEGLFYHPARHPSGQWVLLPKDPSFRQTHQFIDCLLQEFDRSLCPLD